ncbi:aldehyde dehydrogenase family protein [Parafrankia elaeagni]|uniref:aldehyde dehydrogenase family protein n=1 Tax=Parafrankia elaeagni TaxID=222534 RepID=UPI0003A12D95|nr:aldehyde dehydrogenase [Parafrankia elaeagni]
MARPHPRPNSGDGRSAGAHTPPARATVSPGSREKPLLSYPSYIGGKDVEGVGWVYTVSSRSLLEDVFTSVSLKRSLEQDPDPLSPAAQHGYVTGRCAVVADADVDTATEAAAAAVPEWAAVPLSDRLRLGRLFREKLLEHEETFLEILVAEAHPRRLARWELACLLQVFSEASCSFYEQQMYAEFTHGPRRLIIRRQPDGVVCLNPPQNAPAPSSALAVLALMAGNAVVVRAPRSIALSTMFLLRELVVPLLDELGAPPGTLNVICGKPAQMLDRWLEHPQVNDILYFGGSEAGLRFEQECVARGKKPILELAGNDSFVVWKDADLPLAVEAITECFYGSGQICMVPNHVIVHPEVAEELLRLLKERAETIRPGFPDDDEVVLSPVRRSEKFFALLRQAIAGGGELVTGGRRLEVDGTPSQAGMFLEPTVVRVNGLAGARGLDMVRHETFFPLLPVVVPAPTPDDELLAEIIDFTNANEYGLRNSFWSGSPTVVERYISRLRNGGLVKVNDSHIGFLPYLPTHGGTGLTGGAFGEANYPILKTSHIQGVSIATGVVPSIAAFER